MVSFDKNTQVASFHLLFFHLYFLVFLFISINEFPLASHCCHEEDRKALLDLKSALHDPSNRLASWKEGNQHYNCCDWPGIGCSSDSFRVTSIDLRNTDIERYIAEDSNSLIPNTWLQGRISPSLFNIIHLEYLDLSYNDFQESQIPYQFSGLTKLAHLDLSMSNFSSLISTQFTNLSSLLFLDLSCHEEHHYYWSTSCIKSSSGKWLGGLVNLQVLRLRGISLQESFGQHISYLSKLRYLDLSSCSISGTFFPINGFHNFSLLSSLKMNFLSHDDFLFLPGMANLTSLSILELSESKLQGSIQFPPQLEELDLSFNQDLHVDLNRIFKNQWPKLRKLWVSKTEVNGSFLHMLSNMSSLVSLSAYSCSIQGSLPSSVPNLSQLQYLDFSENSITGDIRFLVSNISQLQYLDLSENSITGDVQSLISDLKYLYHLDLSHNKFQGTIPSSITKLRHLTVFRASGNSIEGNVSLSSLINELNLTTLDLSSNRLTVVIDEHLHLYPILQLETLQLESCNLKGIFPTTIICNLTHLRKLDLSLNNLTGAIPSCLFKLKYLEYLDLSRNKLTGAITSDLTTLNFGLLNLSNNKLRGPLPLLPLYIVTVDVSNNQFGGEISVESGKRLTTCGIINLSGNKLSGPSLSSLCLTDPGGFAAVFLIDLSRNNLSGSIPPSIGQCTSLYSLNLGNNNLSGHIPNELELAPSLSILQLNGNNLEGTLNFINKLQQLEVLNLGHNNFRGTIPTGLGSLHDLKILSLRSNNLSGSIPEGIIHLENLQILDLSMNNLSGPIPRKMGNLTRLLSRTNDISSVSRYADDPLRLEMVIKGITVQFEGLYTYSSGIDLSCNILDGNIPQQIGLLKGLAVLNLSHNCFSDSIPTSVGEMAGLESLDLSSNRLCGHIPQSLTVVDNLEFLNLSYNKLNGRIPRGNHFDTLSLDGSAFIGNELLCGFPTKKLCEGDRDTSISNMNATNEVDEVDQEDAKEKLLLYAIVALGVVVGFWGLFLVLLLKKEKWWFPYWKFVDSVAVRITSYILHN